MLPDATGAVAALALGAIAVLAVAHLLSARLTASVAGETHRTVQRRLVDAYLAAPWPAQNSARPGELQELVLGKSMMISQGTQEAARVLATTFNLLVIVVAALAISPWATLGLGTAVGAIVLLGRPFRLRARGVVRKSARASTALAGQVGETTLAARDLRIFGVEDAARDQLDERIVAASELMEASRTNMLATPALTRDATMAVIVIALAGIVAAGDVALPAIGATVLLLLRGVGLMQGVTGFAHRLDERLANLELVRDALDRWRPPRPAGTADCPPLDTLELRGVSYTHVGAHTPAVHDVELTIARGEQIGLVGPTGAGKTTLAGLLLGTLAPDAGDVLVGGLSLAEIDPDQWHHRIAWVGQDPRLLTGTVAENVRFLRPGVEDAAIDRAVEAAGLAVDLAGWPDGLEHPVGSAGRLGLRRAAPADRDRPRAGRRPRAARARRAHERARRPRRGGDPRRAGRDPRPRHRRRDRPPPVDDGGLRSRRRPPGRAAVRRGAPGRAGRVAGLVPPGAPALAAARMRRNTAPMLEDSAILVRRGEPLTAEVDGEVVMFHPTDGTYFALGQVGSRVWELLEAPIPLGDLLSRLGREFDVDEPTCRADVQAFLAELQEAELVEARG